MFRASCVDMFLPILYIIYTHIYTNINIFIIALFYYNIYCIIRYRIYARHVTFIDRGSCRDSSPIAFSLCPFFSSSLSIYSSSSPLSSSFASLSFAKIEKSLSISISFKSIHVRNALDIVLKTAQAISARVLTENRDELRNENRR